MGGLDDLYQELILDHYRRKRGEGSLEQPSVAVDQTNPLCGDEVHVELGIEDGRLVQLAHTGQGCSISQASVSMMTQRLKGKTPEEATALIRRFTEMMHGDAEAARDKALGDLRALAGVSKFPVRVRCAMLAWNALEEALKAS